MKHFSERIAIHLFSALLLFILFSAPRNTLKAQNTDWHPIPDSLPSLYYNQWGNSQYGKNLRPGAGIDLDSIRTKGGNTIYHLTPVARDTSTNTYRPCWDISTGGVLGKKIIRKDTGHFILFNGKKDSIRLMSRKGLGERWPLYIYPNSDTLIGTISSITSDSVLSSYEKIKTIELTRVDSGSGNLVPDTINGTRIRIGKETGLVEFPSFYGLPYRFDTNYPNNGGTFELFRQGLYTRHEIYKKEIGDLFHIDEDSYEDGINSISQIDTRWKVIDKSSFPSQDSVSYQIARKRVFYDFDPTIGVGYTITDTVLDTINKGYGDLSQPFINGIPHEFIDTGQWSGNDPIMYELDRKRIPVTSDDCAKRASIYFDEPSFDHDSQDSCYKKREADEFGYYYQKYTVGLGRTESYDFSYHQGQNYFYDDDRMVYYEKGSKKCGEGLIVVGQRRIAQNNSPLKVYPNPFKSSFHIKGLSSKIQSATLYDLQGRRLRHFQISNTEKERRKVQTQGLESGTYILKVQTKHKSFTKKLIKK